MTTKTVVLNDFSKALKDHADRHIDSLKGAAVKGIIQSLPDVVEQSPVDTGLYAQSWNFEETELAVLFGNTAPHAPIVELGARPFTPPLAPLLQWAKRVLKDPSQPPDYSSQVWALAKGVQKKIAEQGIKPRHVLEKALPGIIENIRKEMEKL